MREVHFCKTCDFRLPYCVRTDRRFCGQRCRVWWYWHPGVKRFDFSPSGWGLPKPPRKGQPKTFAAALKTLAESRQYAAELEAAARKMQLVDHALRSKVTALRGEMVASKSEYLKELDALRDELEEAEQRLSKAERPAEGVAQTDQANEELASLRSVRHQESLQHADEVRVLRSQIDSMTAERDDLNRMNADLLRRSDERRGQAAENPADLRAALARAESECSAERERADVAEQTLAERDEEVRRQCEMLGAAERAHQGVHLVAQSESRSLHAEKDRRIAAEQRVEQLTREMEALANDLLSRTVSHDPSSLLENPISALIAENRQIRGHRDKLDAERELLAARLLEWMSPGQYLEHAAAADYDITKDPLIQIKAEEIRIENELSLKQAEEKEEGKETKATARALDPKQTVVEQAYAAALSDRWGIKHKPHKRHKQVEWSVIGILLDEPSEEYLMKRAQRRIAWMRRKQAAEVSILRARL